MNEQFLNPALNPQAETGLHNAWQKELLDSISSVDELLREKLITVDEVDRLKAIGDRFRVRIPRYYASLIDKSSLGLQKCPIRKQALPSIDENDFELPAWAEQWSLSAFGRKTPWLDDAIGDIAKLAAPRLTHRYENRAILHVSSLCALYCRFCFRKAHLNDSERTLYEGSLDSAFQYLKSHHEIRELILTGGDPLSLTDAWFETFLERAEEIPHLKHIRIHSRMPVTLPNRMTLKLAQILGSSKKRVSIVTHFNHPKECTSLSDSKLSLFLKHGIALYNQSVLLAGVNDNEHTLYTLFQNLYESGVTPFYLHHPDWTPGTFHYRHSIQKGLQLMTTLRGKLSGPALPDYVLDLPEGHGKISLLSDQIEIQKTYEDSESRISGEYCQIETSHTLAHARHGSRKIYYVNFWR